MSQLEPLSVSCPLCLVSPGDPCEQVVKGWITVRPQPHDLRVRVAAKKIDIDQE